MNDILEKATERGYWKVIIRPDKYNEERIPTLAECKDAVRENAVLFRGWDYPHWNNHKTPSSGLDYVEQGTDWEDHIEWWRFYQSGQFIHYQALWIDWYDAVRRFGPQNPYKAWKFISFLDILYTVTEIYEFASRLGSKKLLGNECVLHIELVGVKGRSVVSMEPSRPLMGPYTCETEKSLPKKQKYRTQELIANSAELAMDHVVWLLERFNWEHPPKKILKGDQQKLIERRL